MLNPSTMTNLYIESDLGFDIQIRQQRRIHILNPSAMMDLSCESIYDDRFRIQIRKL